MSTPTITDEVQQLETLFPEVPESSIKWLAYEKHKRELLRLDLTPEEYEGRIDVILEELNL